MADIVSKEKRSQMMSGIPGKDTKQEIALRSALHRKGFRFRKNVSNLPGKPDIVLKKYNTVIFVHGCFWHLHGCHMGTKRPLSRMEFWNNKLEGNKIRDIRHFDKLIDSGWRVLIVWECAFKGKTRIPLETISLQVQRFLSGKKKHHEIKGKFI